MVLRALKQESELLGLDRDQVAEALRDGAGGLAILLREVPVGALEGPPAALPEVAGNGVVIDMEPGAYADQSAPDDPDPDG